MLLYHLFLLLFFINGNVEIRAVELLIDLRSHSIGSDVDSSFFVFEYFDDIKDLDFDLFDIIGVDESCNFFD